MDEIVGKIIKVGNDVDTDIIIPTQYMTLRTIAEMSKYAFEPLRPEIPSIVKKGDILLCGSNFGCGSSREQAPSILKELGFSCIIAKSFARIFYRNALNNGMLVLQCEEVYDYFEEGDILELDLNNWKIYLKDKEINIQAIPENFKEIIEFNGIVNYWRYRNTLKEHI